MRERKFPLPKQIFRNGFRKCERSGSFGFKKNRSCRFSFAVEIFDNRIRNSGGGTAGVKTRSSAASPETIQLGVPQTAIRACFGNKCSQVRILPPRSTFQAGRKCLLARRNNLAKHTRGPYCGVKEPGETHQQFATNTAGVLSATPQFGPWCPSRSDSVFENARGLNSGSVIDCRNAR